MSSVADMRVALHNYISSGADRQVHLVQDETF